MKSHKRIVLSLGTESVFTKISEEEVDAIGSTDTKLVGVSYNVSQSIWANIIYKTGIQQCFTKHMGKHYLQNRDTTCDRMWCIGIF